MTLAFFRQFVITVNTLKCISVNPGLHRVQFRSIRTVVECLFFAFFLNYFSFELLQIVLLIATWLKRKIFKNLTRILEFLIIYYVSFFFFALMTVFTLACMNSTRLCKTLWSILDQSLVKEFMHEENLPLTFSIAHIRLHFNRDLEIVQDIEY